MVRARRLFQVVSHSFAGCEITSLAVKLHDLESRLLVCISFDSETVL